MYLLEFLRTYCGLEPKFADPYGDWLGYVIEDVDMENKKLTTSLIVREEHLSPSGAVHGGVISGFLDFSCGCVVFAALKEGELCSTVELNVKYFKPITLGEKIITEAELVHRGNRLCSVLAKTYKAKNTSEPAALATGTFNIYPIRSVS